MADHLRIAHDGPVATVTMARPEVHNAFNEDLVSELYAAFGRLAGAQGTRVVVLEGEGKSFSAGADLEWMRRMSQATEAENRADAERLAAMLRAVAECPKPVVARVQGAAIGGGAGLTACADIAIAAESATIGFAEVRLGLLPATISPHVIEKIGVGRALPLFLTGEHLTAQRALEVGLVHRVTPDSELDAAVQETVGALLSGSPAAQTAIKTMVRRVADQSRNVDSQDTRGLQDVDKYTSELIASIRASDEGREGVSAFLEKRKPGWSPE